MAGIKEAIRSIIGQLKTVAELQTVRIFNNDFRMLEEGKTEVFGFPCAFVQVPEISNFSRTGAGYEICDLIVRILIGHEFYNGTGFSQDFDVFDLKDKVVRVLSGFSPEGCSQLTRVREEQSFDHNNVYVYTVDFSATLIDGMGSPYEKGDVFEFAPYKFEVIYNDKPLISDGKIN